jgi:DNA-binding NarL/FixJ family response regulator
MAAGSTLAFDKPTARTADGPRVLIVDDDPGFRAVIVQLVQAADGLRSVGAVGSGEDAVVAVAELRPDLVLMDVVMPGLGGIGAARQIKETSRSTVVVLVSTTHPEDLPREARECLADEIVWKSDLRPALLQEIWQRHCL